MPEPTAQAPGLHLIGFTNPPTGNLREMARDARRIARVLRARIAGAQREAGYGSSRASSLPTTGSQK